MFLNQGFTELTGSANSHLSYFLGAKQNCREKFDLRRLRVMSQLVDVQTFSKEKGTKEYGAFYGRLNETQS